MNFSLQNILFPSTKKTYLIFPVWGILLWNSKCIILSIHKVSSDFAPNKNKDIKLSFLTLWKLHNNVETIFRFSRFWIKANIFNVWCIEKDRIYEYHRNGLYVANQRKYFWLRNTSIYPLTVAQNIGLAKIEKYMSTSWRL